MRIQRWQFAGYDPWAKGGPCPMPCDSGEFVRYDDVKEFVEAHNEKQPEKRYEDYDVCITITRDAIK